MTETKDLIIGYGQIGKALYKCYEEGNKPLTWDIKEDSKWELEYLESIKIECMHICIPFNNKKEFIESVVFDINLYDPEVVIIHSTVPVGTTKEIYNLVINDKPSIVIAHSSCRGVHPDLYESIKFIFPKIFGLVKYKEDSYIKINNILSNKMGIKSVDMRGSSEESELAKILSTTVYAWHIAIVTEIKRYCVEYGVNFDTVFTNWTEDYNVGYQKLGKGHFTRPILKPHKGGIFGGHCIVPNINLIKKYMKDTWLTKIEPKEFIEEKQ